MGQSTDAILCYGFSFDDEGPIWTNTSEFDEELDPQDWEAVLDEKLVNAGKSYGVRDKARAALGVTIVQHCSGECPMYMLAIPSTVVTAYRGSPVKVRTTEPAAIWDKRLRDFAELMGIDLTGKKAGWWICSDWN